MSITRRSFAAIAATVSMAFVLSACGGGSAPASGGGITGDPNNAKITFWDNNAGPDRTPIYQAIIERFQKANPGITVEYVGLPGDSSQQKYQTAIAGGSPPDVGILYTAYTASLAAQNALLPLDGLLAQSSLATQLGPGDVKTVRDTGGSDKLFAIPMSGNLATLWYRTDMFAAKGLKAPATWNDFFSAAATLTDTGKQEYGFTLRGGGGSIYPLLQAMYAYSGVPAFFDAQGNSTVNDPKNIEAVQKLAGLYQKATPTADVNNGYTQMVAQFDGANTAMMQHNLGSLPNHVKAIPGKFAAEPLPAGLSGARNLIPDSHSVVGVFQGSKNQAAAWKFVEFLVSPSENSFWNQKVGQLPTNTVAYSDDWVKNTQSVQAAVTALSDPKTTIVTPPLYLPEFGTITGVDMPPLWQKVILGQLPAKDFADQFAAKLTAAQKKYGTRQK